jgi:hypothetical protein
MVLAASINEEFENKITEIDAKPPALQWKEDISHKNVKFTVTKFKADFQSSKVLNGFGEIEILFSFKLRADVDSKVHTTKSYIKVNLNLT